MTPPVRSASKTYLINMTSCVVYRLLQMSVLIWVNQYLLKRIPTEEFSLYPLILSLMLFGDLFKSIFTGGIARFLVASHARGDKVEATRITSSMLPVLAGAAIVIFGGAALASWQVERLIHIDPAYVGQARTMLLLLAGVMCVNVVTTPFQSGLYIRQEFIRINLIDLATEVLRIVVLLTLLFAVSAKVIWLVVASSLAGLTSTALMIIATRQRMPELHFDRKLVSWQQAKVLLGFSVWTCTEGFTGIAARSLPLLFLNRFAGAVDVTIFHLANLADSQVKQLLAAAMRPAQPALTALHAVGRNEMLKELYYRGGRYHLWILLLPAGPIFCFGADLMGLYAGHEFRGAGYVLMAFFLRYPFTYASAMYYRLAHAAGKVRTYYICDAILQGVIILAMYYVLRFGGGGAIQAAWCACIAQSIFHLLVIWPLGLRFIEGRWPDFIKKTLVPGYLPVVFSTMFCFALKSTLVADNWPTMIGIFAAGMLINMATIGVVSLYTDDRSVFRKIKDKLRRRAEVSAS